MFPKGIVLLKHTNIKFVKKNLNMYLVLKRKYCKVTNVHISSSSPIEVIIALASAAAALFGRNARALGFS